MDPDITLGRPVKYDHPVTVTVQVFNRGNLALAEPLTIVLTFAPVGDPDTT